MTGENDHDRAERLTVEALAHDERVAGLVAEVENLHRAMDTRAVIEQAKGVIMRTMGCGPEAAFAALVVQSQAENRKLHEIAAELADAQERPPPGTDLTPGREPHQRRGAG